MVWHVSILFSKFIPPKRCLYQDQWINQYSWLPNVTTMRKDPHACTIGWNIDSNKPHASPGLYNSNAFVVIKASPISSQKSHIVLNKPHASLFGHYIEMNKPSLRNKAIGCYISQSRVDPHLSKGRSDLKCYTLDRTAFINLVGRVTDQDDPNKQAAPEVIIIIIDH